MASENRWLTGAISSANVVVVMGVSSLVMVLFPPSWRDRHSIPLQNSQLVSRKCPPRENGMATPLRSHPQPSLCTAERRAAGKSPEQHPASPEQVAFHPLMPESAHTPVMRFPLAEGY